MEYIKLEHFEEKKAVITVEDLHISQEEEIPIMESNPSPFTLLGINIMYWSIIGATAVISISIVIIL